MTTSSEPPSHLILRTAKDWPQWFSIIKDKAESSGVWEYINPSPSVVSVPVLTPPPEPSEAGVLKEEGQGPNQLVTVDVQASRVFEFRLKVWKTKYREYERKSKALNDINEHIVKTCGSHYAHIQRTRGVRERLVTLKQAVAPTILAHKLEVKDRYMALQRGPGSQGVSSWLAEWDLTLGEAMELSLPLAQGIQPTVDFLHAIYSTEPSFYQLWMNQITMRAIEHEDDQTAATASIPDGIKIAKIFRMQHVSNKSMGASATLQGGEASSRAGDQKERCFGGSQKHSPEDCWTLHPEKRPDDWEPNIRHVREVVEHLDEELGLKEKFSEVYRQLEEILETHE